MDRAFLKFAVLGIVIFNSIRLYADNYSYKSFVKEGKVWKLGYISENGPVVTRTIKIMGDTLINGLWYKKVYTSTESEDFTYFTALREVISSNNLIVTRVFNEVSYPVLAFDFNAPNDELIETGWGGQGMVIHEKKLMKIRDYTIYYYDAERRSYGQRIYSPPQSFYERLGVVTGSCAIFSVYDDYWRESLVISCEEDDQIIYQWDDKIEDVTGINSIKTEELEKNNKLFDLTGRRITNPNKGEFYIQNGRKIRK